MEGLNCENYYILLCKTFKGAIELLKSFNFTALAVTQIVGCSFMTDFKMEPLEALSDLVFSSSSDNLIREELDCIITASSGKRVHINKSSRGYLTFSFWGLWALKNLPESHGAATHESFNRQISYKLYHFNFLFDSLWTSDFFADFRALILCIIKEHMLTSTVLIAVLLLTHTDRQTSDIGVLK